MLFVLQVVSTAQAQQDKQKLDLFLQKLKSANTSSPGSSIKYTYAKEATPDIVEDSIIAEMEVLANGFHYKADSTEMFGNDSLLIILFLEEKIMYLSRARRADPAIQPAALLDTLFTRFPGLNYMLLDSAGLAVLRMNFPEGNQYKSIAVCTDHEGKIQRVDYVVKSEALMEPDAGDEGKDDADAYAVVRAVFSYNPGNAGTPLNLFRPEQFFIKENGRYKAIGRYSDYQVQIGSGNL